MSDELLTDSEYADLARGQRGFRAVLRAHEPLPGLPKFCSCGHRAQTPYQRETHLVEALISTPTLRGILRARCRRAAS